MTKLRRLFGAILVCSVAVTSVGCTSMKAVRPVTSSGAGTTFGTLKPGDSVQLRTVDGRTVRFRIQQVDADAIVAPNGVRYTSAEIVTVKRRSFSGLKTAGLAAGIFVGFLLYVLAAGQVYLGPGL